MANRKEVKMGVIGTSKRGLKHIKNFQLIKEVKLTAICDQYDYLVKKAYDLMEDKKNVKCYTDHKKMLKEADIEAVSIVVEPENNIDVVCDALEAGKHVLSEVPLALTIEDCWRAVLAVEKCNGLKFQMAEHRRFSPFVETWKNMVDDGALGKILLVEGQYIHGLGDDRWWVDSETGRMITLEEAKNNPNAIKSRIWKMEHWIKYLPHDLSPFCKILDDRVKTVSCMATRKKSYIHEWLPISDMEVALMHTEKDTLMRLVTSFSMPNYKTEHTGHHWYEMMGTRGRVETNRTDDESMKMWLADSYMSSPAQVMWERTKETATEEILKSGHSGNDLYPPIYFVRSILEDTQTKMDVYKAADAAAPAIMAAKSAEMGGKPLEVPDFRTNRNRKLGQPPIIE